MALRLRVLTISKPYVAAAYRQKLTLLAAGGDFDVGLICPPAWGAQAFEPAPDDDRLWIRQADVLLNGSNHMHLYRGLGALVREFRPDVLNVEEEHYSLVTWQCFRLARQVGAAPLFYAWQNILKTYPPPFSWTMRAVFRAAAGAVCGNAEAAAVLRAQGYRGPLAEIPQMGVDAALFAPADATPAARKARQAALGLDPAAFWVGFAGRIVEEKGLATLVEALALLAAAGGAPVAALILGTGPGRAVLAELAAARGVAGRITWVPHVPSRGVAPYLQAIDALCLPSRTRANWKEQFGRVLIEAMAAEAVVVGSSSGEIPRVIGDAGVVFPEGDAVALAAELARLAADPARAAALRRAGTQRVRERYTNTAVAASFATAFRQAAACASRKSLA